MKHTVTGTSMSQATHRLVLKSGVAVLAAAGLLSAFPVVAQETTPASDAAQPAPEATVTVTGVRRAAQSAQKIKKDADNVIDSIVADDIGKFPDTNVAETLARVTGVQVRRDGGEANTVLIRGLPGIATLLNGRELFTTTGRYIQLADIPSTMLQRVDVYKSQSADLPEGGIAGVIDVRTNRPFDFKGFTAVVNGGATNNSQAERTDPNVSGMISNRWKTDIGEIGALFGVSYVRNHYSEERAFNTKPIDKSWLLPNLTGPDLMGLQAIGGDRRRTAGNYALQWKPNQDLEVYAEGLATHYLDNNETDYLVALPWWGPGDTMSGTKIPGSNQLQTLTSKNVNTIMSTQANRKDNVTQQHAIGARWNAAPGLRLSTELARTLSDYDWQNPILDTLTVMPNSVVTTNAGGGANISYSGQDITNPANYRIDQLFDRYGHDHGSSTDWRADGTYTMADEGLFKDFGFGVRAAKRTAASIKSFEGTSVAPDGVPVTSLPGLNCTASMQNNWGTTAWYTPCASYLLTNTGAVRQAVTGTSAARAMDPGSYFADEEKNYALYGKAHIGWDTAGIPIDGVLGMRVTKTDSDLLGNSVVGTAYVPTSKTSSDTAYLPSANFKATLRDDVIARFSVTKTLTRPDFGQLNPGTAYINANGTTNLATASGGNPDLKPFTARNYDGSLEWYFSSTGMASVALFRHEFKGYIQNKVVKETFNGAIYDTTRPFNTDDGYLQGAEVAYRTFFDKLPGWLGGFGVEANATYTEGQTSTASDPSLSNKPFAGMSKWSYNVVGLYEKFGVSARLAYNWRSKFVQIYNDGGPGLDLIASPMSSLDGSLGYKINENTSITLTGSNLLNFKYTDYWSNKALYPRDTRRYDRSVGVFLNWKI
ncbi:TonB-dependent receptor [Duganella dendranthematis]|uniref:TonB-dependent receptor n=1 Tax=Duganella dendranthematis TaxID=2728021 RepID=A0ABX6MIB9_9BURK|nr:TonB-dependent receptor [Duganella dendranthematis]QJD93765.1 TonB-dependent receptor [Duganella dendranthematis]